jgi:hypothetical protein
MVPAHRRILLMKAPPAMPLSLPCQSPSPVPSAPSPHKWALGSLGPGSCTLHQNSTIIRSYAVPQDWCNAYHVYSVDMSAEMPVYFRRQCLPAGDPCASRCQPPLFAFKNPAAFYKATSEPSCTTETSWILQNSHFCCPAATICARLDPPSLSSQFYVCLTEEGKTPYLY